MKSDWIKIFSTQDTFKANLVEAVLREHNINCHILNKQDSAYVAIGELEIYVPEREQQEAEKLIQQQGLE